MTVDVITTKVLTDNFVGSPKWLIKLTSQIIARYLKFLEDQVLQGSNMGTERIMFVIEDLFKLQGKKRIIIEKLANLVKNHEKV